LTRRISDIRRLLRWFGFGSSTDLTAPKSDFRSSPKNGLKSAIALCPVRANSSQATNSRQVLLADGQLDPLTSRHLPLDRPAKHKLATLLREVTNTVGKKGRLGEQVRCVLSVSMLTEEWDANTVTHNLLTSDEQTLPAPRPT
jgi:hypothetical protein